MATISLPLRGHKFAEDTPSAATDNEIVAAAGANVKIRVMAMAISANGTANDVTVKSATTAIAGIFHLAANGGAVLNYNPYGWFETNANEALNVALSSATAVGVTVTYVLTT